MTLASSARPRIFVWQFKDKLTALRIVLFLTFEDPQSRCVAASAQFHVSAIYFLSLTLHPMSFMHLGSKFAYWLGIFLFFSIILNCVAFITGSIKTTQCVPRHTQAAATQIP